VVQQGTCGVREDFRRRGLGTWLIESVERLALERGFKRLTLMVEPDNHPAISLYLKLGLRFFKQTTEFWRGRPRKRLCMEKLAETAALVDLRKRERETRSKLCIEGRIRPKFTRGIACGQILKYVF